MSQQSHLYRPTNATPFQVNESSFYGDYFLYNNRRYEYQDIISIRQYSSYSQTGMISESKVFFKVYLNVTNGNNFPIEARENNNALDLSVSNWFVFGSNRKTREKVEFVSHFMKQATFDSRLLQYVRQLRNENYFHYPNGNKIFNNGDIQRKGKIVGNILDAKRNNTLVYGDLYFESVTGLSSYHDPYALQIYPQNSRLRFGNYLLQSPPLRKPVC
jgi:hypothetical protein